MAVIDELLVAIGLDAGDLDAGAASAASDFERRLRDIESGAAGTAVGGDFLDALAAALTPSELDAEINRMLDAEQAASAAGVAAGDALADGVAAGADQAAADVEQRLGGIDTAVAGAAVAGLFIAGMQSAMDLATVTGNIGDQLNLTAGQAQRAGDVAGQVYSAGFGGSLEDVQAAIVGVGSSVTDVADLTDSELQGMTESALALATTFDVDVSEASTAAGHLIRNDLVDDATEAFDVMTAAAGAFPRSMLADIPATITEYGEHFERLGLDAATSFGLMSQFVAAGGRDIDQAADVVHEFSRITYEETDRAAAAFQELGLDAEGMLSRIHSGGPEAASAMGETLQALRDLGPGADQSRLAVELFGDMAGESSDALFAMDPATAAAEAGLDRVAGASKTLTDSMEASPAQQMDAAMRSLQTTLGSAFLPVIMTVSGFLAEHQGLLQILVPVVLGLATAIALLTVAQWAYNAALFASGIPAIVLAVAALVAGIVYLATETTVFQTIWTTAWGWIQDAAQSVWNWVRRWWPLLLGFLAGPPGLAVGLIIRHFDRLRDGAGAAIDWVRDKVASGIGWVEDRIGDLGRLPGQVRDWFGDVGSTVADSVSGAWRSAMNAVIGGWNSLSIPLPSIDLGPLGSIGGGSIDFPNIPYLASGGIVPATPGGMLAVLGEGREDEVVAPLSDLDSMLRSVAGAVRSTPSREDRLIVELRPRELFRLVDEGARKKGGSTAGVTRRGGGSA